ncbi:MAG TPA: hypothetical protein VG899_02040 [Mycobacteriales bacterium]|nr:hypothetical protein [Mycobacteriales bacterium]
MLRRTALAATVLTATASLLAGCGGGSSGGGSANTSNDSSLSPQAELTSAVQALGNASTLTATVKLGADGSQLLSFVKAQDKSAKLTSAQASEIAGISLSFEVAAPSGEKLSQLTGLTDEGAANISVSEGSKSLVTIRSVNKTLYLQADLKDVLNDLGQAATYRQMTAAAGQLPGFLGALVQGKWVSLPLSTLKSLSGSLGAVTSATPDAAKSHQFLSAIEGLLTKDVTVTRTSSGSTDNLTLTANLRTLAGDVTSTFATLVPGAGAALGSADVSSAPNKNVTLDAMVTNGALSSLSFDLGQIAKSGNGTLPLDLAFAQSGAAITAPSGATAVDLSTLTSLLGSFGGGGI